MAEVRRRIAWTPFEESALTRGFAKVPLHRLTSLFPSIFGPGRCYPSISRRAKAPIDDTWQSLFSPMFLSNPTQYGALSNSWAHILADPSLGETLKARSNTDLKDKWRNMQRAAAQGGRSVPTTTALQPSAQPPKAQPPKRKHSALNQGKRSASEAAGAGAAASEGGRVKREQVGNAKVDSPANAVPAAVAAAAPAFIYVILKQPSFAVLESVKLGKRIKLAAAKLTAPAAEVCCPAYATLEAAQATAQSALLTYLNGKGVKSIWPNSPTVAGVSPGQTLRGV
jgi:hypothetical protein